MKIVKKINNLFEKCRALNVENLTVSFFKSNDNNMLESEMLAF